MSSVNKAILLGRLGADIESFTFQNGDQIYRGSIATSTVWTDNNGQKQESVDWHNIQLKADRFKNVAPFLKKGVQIFVEGKIKYTKTEEKYFTSIHVFNLVLLSNDKSNESSNQGSAKAQKPVDNTQNEAQVNDNDDTEDNLPF